MRVVITCEACGHRHRLARPILTPEPIWVICHSCELPLRADPPAPLRFQWLVANRLRTASRAGSRTRS